MPEVTCPRCQQTFDALDDMRFRSGEFVEHFVGGGRAIYDTLCEDCHREVVRN